MSSTSTMSSFDRGDKTLVVLPIGLPASIALHAGILLWAAFKPVTVHTIDKPIEMQIVQIEPPKPPPPPPEPPKPLEQPKPKLKPPPIKVAEVKPPPTPEPPPPIEEAKEPP